MSSPSPAVVSDRAAGAIVASACGDALGAPWEFGPSLDSATPLAMTGGGPFGFEPGEWTDDTQMALAILTPLASGDRDPVAVERGFLEWFWSGPQDVGNQTRSVLGSGAPLIEAAQEYQRSHIESAGNGGLMRIAPVALAYPNDSAKIAAYAREVTALTHADPDCLDASVLWALAVDRCIHEAPNSTEPWDFAETVRAGLPHLATERRERWSTLIQEAESRPAADFSNNGWVIHAFQAALAAIVQTPVPLGAAPCRHLADAIEAAVRCGGDTDTVAAISGSLLGARWGETAVPARWRSVVFGHRAYGQPQLRVADLDAMARLALTGGRPDAQGWPGVGALSEYYGQRFGTQEISETIEEVTFGNVAGLQSALDSGSDVVVSLCRMGTGDVPQGVEHFSVGLIDSDIDDNPNLPFVLADTADFIASKVATGRHVYVHCVKAESRTPAIAAAYLARCRGRSLEEAWRASQSLTTFTPSPMMKEGVRASLTV